MSQAACAHARDGTGADAQGPCAAVNWALRPCCHRPACQHTSNRSCRALRFSSGYTPDSAAFMDMVHAIKATCMVRLLLHPAVAMKATYSRRAGPGHSTMSDGDARQHADGRVHAQSKACAAADMQVPAHAPRVHRRRPWRVMRPCASRLVQELTPRASCALAPLLEHSARCSCCRV